VTVRLYDSLTRELHDVSPVDGETVKIYSCGPTVYRYIHIGNMRSFMLGDLIRRALRFEGLEVRWIMNITDVGHMTDEVSDTGRDKMELAEADEGLAAAAMQALRGIGLPVYRGAAWTTDAPFRETEAAIERARARDILAVEMEAAALYAFARARNKPVLCLAHVTNQMAVNAGDFEKGEADGADASLKVIAAVASAWRHRRGGQR